jgi:DNA ligase-1
MRDFAQLYARLDASTSTQAKVDALREYFARVPPGDAAWAVYFLAGGKPRQLVGSRVLREFALSATGLPEWLFEESYQAVGDLAETIALLLPPPTQRADLGLALWLHERLLPLRGLASAAAIARLADYVQQLDTVERFVLFKLIGGSFRVGVSRLLVNRALAQHAGLDAKLVAQRLIGYTNIAGQPGADAYTALLAPPGDAPEQRGGAPYSFFLAHQLAAAPESLGAPTDWLAEWKYDGIRAQLVRRDGQLWLWSRGEELVTERFPEIAAAGAGLPDGTVLDGEVVVWDVERAQPAPFARLQTRIGRKTQSPKLLRETPAVFIAYDLLEWQGRDLRALPQFERRAALEAVVAEHPVAVLRLSPLVTGADWAAFAAQRHESRPRGVEGLMLKRRDSGYGVGRTRDQGLWWKWKIDPLTVDAVLVYAQRGHGRRASLYTDYSFAVWDRAPLDAAEAQAAAEAIAQGAVYDTLPRLVPFAKAYSGLTDAEIRQVDAIVGKTTIEKFGPVRSVKPTQVFELGFEAIQRSTRHKSGIAVRFPRILRWRTDKPLHEADTLGTLQELLAAVGAAGAVAAAAG